MGLHLNERKGMDTMRTLSSEEPPAAASAAANAAAGSSSTVSPVLPSVSAGAATAGAGAGAAGVAGGFDPGMSFDDFLLFYASLSKPLSPLQELQEVWRLLDDQLDGRVPLRVLRQTMIGLEQAAPSTNPHPHHQQQQQSSSSSPPPPRFYDSNYKYHWTPAQRASSAETLIDQSFLTYFTVERGKDLERDTITFAEFCDFMYA
jgi:hypothetical protein